MMNTLGAAERTRPLSIVQISDLHITAASATASRGIDPAVALRETIAAIERLAQRPDAVIVTGDLVDAPDKRAYARLRALLAPLPMPVFLMPGNHDGRVPLRDAFPEHRYLQRRAPQDSIQYHCRIGPLHLLAIDTLAPGHDHGELCDARLDDLELLLSETAGEPVLLALHHPPFETLIQCMDGIGLLHGAERLAHIVAAHANIEHVICGHIHRAISARYAGTVVSTCPAPVYSYELNLASDSRYAYTRERPQLRVLGWTPAAGMIAHLADARPFDGPIRID